MPVLESMQLCPLLQNESTSQLDSFNRAFADWGDQNKKTKLKDLLESTSGVHASHGTLDWEGVRYAFWEDALGYIETIVFGSDDKKKW